MSAFKINIKKNEFTVLETGNYQAVFTKLELSEYAADDRKHSVDFVDPTMQLKATLKTDKGSVTHSLNLGAFLKYEDLTPLEKKSGDYRMSQGEEGYAIYIPTNERVADDEKLEKALAIIGHVCSVAGIEEQDDVDLADIMAQLNGKSVGIFVEKLKGTHTNKEYNKITKWFAPAPVMEQELAEV